MDRGHRRCTARGRTRTGRKPLRVNVVKFAESRRTKNFSVQGAPVQPSVQARTAFQVVYVDGTVMVDAGMDQQVHRFFGRGAEEPYDAVAAQAVAAAVDRARLIVFTHEHGDHVGGVVASPRAAELAVKTILTRPQADALTIAPQMPEIRLTAAGARRYIVIDYDAYHPVAPGMAFIKAAGHTPGSQMVLVQLESGREILLAGDAAWHMDGVRLVAGKDAPWVSEDKPAVLGQLRWLNGLLGVSPTSSSSRATTTNTFAIWWPAVFSGEGSSSPSPVVWSPYALARLSSTAPTSRRAPPSGHQYANRPVERWVSTRHPGAAGVRADRNAPVPPRPGS